MFHHIWLPRLLHMMVTGTFSTGLHTYSSWCNWNIFQVGCRSPKGFNTPLSMSRSVQDVARLFLKHLCWALLALFSKTRALFKRSEEHEYCNQCYDVAPKAFNVRYLLTQVCSLRTDVPSVTASSVQHSSCPYSYNKRKISTHKITGAVLLVELEV